MGKQKAIIGIDSVYYAINTADTVSGATWQAAVALPGITEAGVNPNGAVATLFADNGPAITANSIGEIEVSLKVADLTPVERAALLGHTRTGGVTLYKGNDISPDIALGFRTLLSDSTYGYVWLHKGKFAEAQETFTTKSGSVNFQVPTLTGKFTILEFNGEYKRTTRADDPDYVAATGANWFTNGPLGVADITPPTISSVVPANSATGVVVTTTVAWTFNEAMLSSEVISDHFFLIADVAGTAVAGTLSLNAAKTIVTFTPASSLTALTAYRAIVTTGAKDLAGNRLAAPSVTKFTTA